MDIRWSKNALKDIEYWKKTDTTKIKKIKSLISNIMENPYSGIGKPEALKFEWTGYWSRRINSEHRLIYRYTEEYIEIISCRYHYAK